MKVQRLPFVAEFASVQCFGRDETLNSRESSYGGGIAFATLRPKTLLIARGAPAVCRG
jgi:hypothetical protein